MDRPVTLYRRRYEPEETICLKDDEILLINEDMIVTKWNCLKPRKDIASGISVYLMKEHIKVSKVLDQNGDLVYWYCDIIDTIYNPEENSYVFCDLLIDVLVYGDSSVKIVDLDELGDVLEKDFITKKQAVLALRAANNLLSVIYQNQFYKYQELIEKYSL